MKPAPCVVIDVKVYRLYLLILYYYNLTKRDLPFIAFLEKWSEVNPPATAREWIN